MVKSTFDADDEFQRRLDALLSSAIREKARDEQALAGAVQAVRRDLEKFGQELAHLTKLAQRPYQPILSLLATKLEEVSAAVTELRRGVSESMQVSGQYLDGRMSQESASVSKFVEEWSRFLDARLGQESQQVKSSMEASLQGIQEQAEMQADSAAADLNTLSERVQAQLTGAEEALRTDIEASQEAILGQLGDSNEATAEMLGEIRSVLPMHVSASVLEALRPFSENMREVAAQAGEAVRKMAESNESIEKLHKSLIRYLAERDERLEHVRDQALLELVDKMSEGLKGRTKAKVGEALRNADRRRKDQRDAQKLRQIQGGSPAAPVNDKFGPDWIAESDPWLSGPK